MSAGLAVVTPRETLINAAVWWREHVCRAPETALRRVENWLSAESTELRVLARHVACLAAIEQGRLLDAREHARWALPDAVRDGLIRRAAQLRLTLAWIELERGDAGASERHLAAGVPHLRGSELSQAACLHGLLLCQSDRYEEAVTALTEAARGLRAGNDRHWLANALLARGVARMYLHRLDEAEDDLVAAGGLFAEDGRTARAAACQHNRGCVAFRAGELPRALRLFSQARRQGLDPDAHPEALVDRAEALAAAGLGDAARSALHRAIERLDAHGRSLRMAETKLALAGCALRDGDVLAAERAAAESGRLFRQQDRPAWTALAEAFRWQAKLLSGQRSRFALASARRAARTCSEYGWPGEAAQLHLIAGKAAQRDGRYAAARKLLRLAGAAATNPDLPSPQRAVGWLATALRAQLSDDRRTVFDSCRDGLRAIDSHASAMVDLDLRVHTFGLTAELAEIAVGAALSTGNAQNTLHWAERSRASALNRRALRPPTDPELRCALVELRAATVELRDSRGDPRAIRARVTALEERVRHRAMLVDGATSRTKQHYEMDDVVAALGRSVLLSIFAHSGQLYAVSVMDGDFRLHRLGPEGTVLSEVDRLRYFLARKAAESSLRVRVAYAQGARHAAETIESRLLDPVSSRLAGGRPLVVVPTGRLHVLPWAELPGCRGRSVTVAPSLRCWLRGAEDVRRERPGSEHVWVSGPGLEHAEREVRALRTMSGGRLLVGAAATTERVLDAVDGAETAHIAAHGWFRDDQPQLSCLDLVDGPLYGYDFDRLHRAPTTVVLSACEVGQSAVRRGDELSGLAAALLGRGTATVISSVVPVPDERTAEVMLSLHDGLRRGSSPAAALARAQAAHGESGFLCLGYGGA